MRKRKHASGRFIQEGSGYDRTYLAWLDVREIFPGIGQRQIGGFRGIQLLRRPLGDQVEFVTIMWFDSIDGVRTFAGEDYEAAVVPPEARALLARFDARSQHYNVEVEHLVGTRTP